MPGYRAIRWRWWLAGIAWVAAVGSGFAVLLHGSSSPGEATRAPAHWPGESVLHRSMTQPTLVLFLHPRCACSRASVHELQRLLGRVTGRVATTVALVRPAGVAPGFEAEGARLVREALPAAELSVDEAGREAERFGAQTSGACVLYAADGHLLFAGGVTALRGHEGNSLGQERIVALIDGRAPDRSDSPVFGCALAEQGLEQRTQRHQER